MARTARMVIKESGEEGKLKLDNCNIAMEMHKYIGKTHAKRD